MQPANPSTLDYFVALIQPFIQRENPPGTNVLLDYIWRTTDTDYFAVECNSQVYGMHKDNESLYLSNVAPPDTQAPAVPTGLTLTTPGSQTIQAVWTPNATDTDVLKYRVWYRPK